MRKAVLFNSNMRVNPIRLLLLLSPLLETVLLILADFTSFTTIAILQEMMKTKGMTLPTMNLVQGKYTLRNVSNFLLL